VSLDFQQLRELLLAIAQTDITELSLKSDTFELKVKKGSVAIASELVPVVPTTVTTPSSPTVAVTTPVDNPPVTPPSESTSSPTKTEQQKWVEITSPMVGTFYRAPAPDEPSFVEVGEQISKGDTVCIIEAMKLMNDIEAEVAGEIVEILVENGEPVEYGQALMRVNPR
jgi:acetyl-CoA carboxylase biotin carboxyl carrier protein